MMESWENKLRKSLEEYESPLPEGGLEAFRQARKGHSQTHRSSKRMVTSALLAAAACAALFFLFKSRDAVSDIDTFGKTELTASVEPIVSSEGIADEITHIDNPAAGQTSNRTTTAAHLIIKASSQSKVSVEDPGTSDVQPDEAVNVSQDNIDLNTPEESCGNNTQASDTVRRLIFSPSLLEAREKAIRKVPAVNVMKVSTGIISAGAVGWLASSLMSGADSYDSSYSDLRNANGEYIPSDPTSGGEYDEPDYPIGGRGDIRIPVDGQKIVSSSHRQGARAGLSLGIPLSERLTLHTGIYRSVCSSTFTCNTGHVIEQSVSFIDIPLHIDWTAASFKFVDLYLGGGLEGDFSRRIKVDGTDLQDPLTFALAAEAGVEIKPLPWMGVYIEPTLRWNGPSVARELSTFRSTHPVMFTTSAGIRLNLKQK